MNATLDPLTPVPDATLPPARALPLRLRLFLRSAVVMLTAFVAITLFCFWVTFAALSPLTLVAPALIPLTALVRRYANRHRRAAATLLGEPVPEPYRAPAAPGLLTRITTLLRDPASWRDAWWLIVHGTAGLFLATLSFTLAAASVFYVVYPLLYAVTPRPVFSRPFGDWSHLHRLAETFALVPVGFVLFALWWVVVIPLARAEAGLTRSLLR
jgi:hypothetical protein